MRSPDLPIDRSHAEGGSASQDFDPTWCLVADSDDERARVTESLLCLADGVVGTRGVLEEDHDPGIAPVTAAGVYEPADTVTEQLIELPSWCGLPLVDGLAAGTRILDLRTGVLTRELSAGETRLHTTRFACASRPGTAVLVAELGGSILGEDGGPTDATDSSSAGYFRSPFGGGVAVSSSDTWSQETSASGVHFDVLRRTVVHEVSAARAPNRARAARRLAEAEAAGVDRLLAENRAVWDQRWADADVEIKGDPEATLAVRFAIFHILSTGRPTGETAMGARGLTGPAYAGHVFWDTEVFALPVLAAVDPRAARSVLEYRIRRLDAARKRAASDGRAGARFPWESAHDGADVTPTSGIDRNGNTVAIRTGELEEHLTADVAWAAWRYAAWKGDWSFLTGAGRDLVLEPARYWASRVRWDDKGRAHIDSVTGPDEYHEAVDDNAFTNLMARWNLQRAAELVDRGQPGPDEVAEADEWLRTADALVDNFDPASARYEQFRGFNALESMLVKEIGTPPLAADLVLGAEHLHRTQIIKQADVLMAHLMIPDGVAPGSLLPNIDFYLPRTSHGSSLSPAVHAILLAQAGRSSEALDYLRLAASIDLDDVTQTTSGGLHLANLGGLWQAMVTGFAGLSVISPGDRTLSLAPRLPEQWEELCIRVRWHGRRVEIRCRKDAVSIATDRPLRVTVHGTTARIEPPGGVLG